MEHLIHIKSMVLTYFSTGVIRAFLGAMLLYIFGVVINLGIYFFSKKRYEVKILSDSATVSILAINAFVFALSAIFLKDNIFLLKGTVYFLKTSLWLIFSVNLFLFLFQLTFMKLLKKAKAKSALINSCLLNTALFSNILLVLNNPLIAFIALDVVIISIYNYALNMKFKKQKSFYGASCAIMTILASLFFYVFYIMSGFIENPVQNSIIQICLITSLLLKIGIFPVYNYLQGKNLRTNLPFCVLQSAFLTYLGIIYISKFIGLFNLSNEVIQIVMFTLLSVCALTFALNAFKSSNLIKISANSCYYFYSIIIFNALLFSFDTAGLELAASLLLCFLGIYSLCAVVKINTNTSTITLAQIKGMNKNNSLFCFLFSALALISAGIIPNVVSIQGARILKNIYLYDKIQILPLVILACAYIIMVFGILRVIQNLYLTHDINQEIYMTKRTTLNYVVPIVIILFLITAMLL